LSTALSQKSKNSNNKNKDHTNVAGVILKLCKSFKVGGTTQPDDFTTREMMNVMMMRQMNMLGAPIECQERRERKEE
jgi:hypothetical protein